MNFACSKCEAAISPDWQFCQRCGKRLPRKTNLRRLETAKLIRKFRAEGIEQINASRDILESVAIYANPEACEVCKNADGRVYSLSDSPNLAEILPHQGCTCDNDCACCFAAKTKDIVMTAEERDIALRFAEAMLENLQVVAERRKANVAQN
jgi:hypothetical protein